MKLMTANILFKQMDTQQAFSIIKPNAVQVSSGWKQLTDTATIVLPRNVKDFDKQKVKEVFKNGREVSIQLGYNGNNAVEFVGYITNVSADVPIKIKLEDEMWQLKQIPVNISTKSIKLNDFIKKILPGYDIDVAAWQMPPQRHSRTTVAKVLDYLKSEYKLYSYFVPGTKKLIVGKIYSDDSNKAPVKLHLEKNVRNNGLTYRSKEDVSIKIRAVSTLRNGQKIEALVGDKNGTEQQLAYYGIEVKAELEKVAQRDYDRYKIDGFDGTLTTFGQPVIAHGMKTALTSDQYPDRNGIYYVDDVSVSYDSNGYQRKLKLGTKV